MSKLILYDFKCRKCGILFEELIHSFEHTAKCPNCGDTADRQISAPHIDWRHMGVSSTDFPTAAGKWTKMQWQKRTDKGGRADGAPNLKEY